MERSLLKQEISFGSAVVAAAPDRGDAEAGVCIVVELRAKDCRVQNLDTGRSRWIALRDLRRAREDELAGSTVEVVVRILSMLEALECEMTRVEPGRLRIAASHRAIRPETVDAIRSTLGERLLGYLIRPGSMSRIQTIVEIRESGEITG